MSVTYGQNHFFTTTSFVDYPLHTTEGKMNTSIKIARVKAGYVGQVVANDLAATILWESEPKKTLERADKAARKAQLRAAQRSFE